jgi:hypothetical protein
MKKILWFTAAISIAFLLTSCGTQQATTTKEPKVDVVRFIEDYTVTCNTDKYNIIPSSFKDAKSITSKNIWVTGKFLDDKEHLDIMSRLLENDFNILIQEYNLPAFDAYEQFKIPSEKRAMKTSRESELKDVQPPLQRYGVMLFKYKDMYYAPGVNSINNGKVEDLLVGFTFDKEKMIGK